MHIHLCIHSKILAYLTNKTNMHAKVWLALVLVMMERWCIAFPIPQHGICCGNDVDVDDKHENTYTHIYYTLLRQTLLALSLVRGHPTDCPHKAGLRLCRSDGYVYVCCVFLLLSLCLVVFFVSLGHNNWSHYIFSNRHTRKKTCRADRIFVAIGRPPNRPFCQHPDTQTDVFGLLLHTTCTAIHHAIISISTDVSDCANIWHTRTRVFDATLS